MLKGLLRFFCAPGYARAISRERGYIYFQEFVLGNDHDIKKIVIGKKLLPLNGWYGKITSAPRGVSIFYEKRLFKEEWIDLVFKINEHLGTQSLAVDLVFKNGIPLVVEINYGFVKEGYDPCVGYWDSHLN